MNLPAYESFRAAAARAVLTAMLTFAIDAPPPWRRRLDGWAVAELLVDDPPADLYVLDVVPA